MHVAQDDVRLLGALLLSVVVIMVPAAAVPAVRVLEAQPVAGLTARWLQFLDVESTVQRGVCHHTQQEPQCGQVAPFQ